MPPRLFFKRKYEGKEWKPLPGRETEVLLEVRDLEVTYYSPRRQARSKRNAPPPVKALRGVTFRIRAGESLAVLGESGSGKSSLALSILRLLPPGSQMRGTICFRGVDLLQASERDLRQIRGAQISIIFQQPGMALNPLMRVDRQVTEVIRAHRPRERCSGSRRQHEAEARSVLERLFGKECDRLARAYPHQLSGGQSQRVSIAQALACGPQLIILDEPAASLDAVVQADILQIFHELRSTSSTSLLFITHNPAILPGLADRVIVLRAGELVEEGGLRELYSHPGAPYTAGLLRSAPAPWPE
jgi:ABC-type dipeptide/oligopeptide/nickel transport system ATPase component